MGFECFIYFIKVTVPLKESFSPYSVKQKFKPKYKLAFEEEHDKMVQYFNRFKSKPI